MLPDIGLILTLFFASWIFVKRFKYPEYLIILPFIISTDLFGFASSNFLYTKGLLDTIDYATILTIIISLSFRKHSRFELVTKFRAYNRYIKFFFVFLVLILIYSIIAYFDIKASFKNFKNYLNYVDYFFFLYFLSYLTEEQIKKLINLIENLTITISVLYILNYGLNIDIFRTLPYLQENYLTVVIYRSFATLPYFIIFIIAKNLLELEISYKKITKIFILFLAIFFTYTRTYYLVILILLVLPIPIKILDGRKKVLLFDYLVKTFALLFAILIIITTKFNANLDFFMTRIHDIYSIGTVYETANIQLRAQIINDRIDFVEKTNPVIGLGFFQGKSEVNYFNSLYDNEGNRGYLVTGDQSVGNVIANLGFFGSALFIILLLYPAIYYTKIILSNKRQNYLSDNILTAAVITLIIEVLILSFISMNLFLNVDRIAFLMALIITLLSREQSKSSSLA